MTLHEILEALDTLSEEDIDRVREHLAQRQAHNPDEEQAWFKPGMTYPLLTPYGNESAAQSLLQALEEAKVKPFSFLYVPHNEADYHRLVGVLDRLIDQVGEDEAHPLASLMEVISVLIEKYEDEHIPKLDDI